MSPRKSISTGNNVGIRYEHYINQLLKNKGFQPKTIISAGATDSPNGFVNHKAIQFPIEIKKDLSADFAQIELNWDINRKFSYSKRSKNNEFISILSKEKFLDEINDRWKGVPQKFTKKILTTKDRYQDLDEFPDIKREIDATLIEQFYNLKNPPIYYIQIGGHGFFYMGKDVTKLGVPRLIGKGILRARIKTRNSRKNQYGFLVAIKLRRLKPSTHGIEEKDGRVFPFK
jgi:hypothetical protein